MRKSIFATFTAAVAVAAALLLTGCERAIDMTGKSVSFAAGISDGASGLKTRVAYGAETSGAQAIDWIEGDRITIYCAQCENKQSAVYKVQDIEKASADDMYSYAGLANAESDGAGLRWGTGDHTFYAVYPGTGTDGATVTIQGKDITGSIPATQGFTGEITGTDVKVVAPDMRNMYMTAKAGPYEPESDDVVLDFKPLTTVLEFTVTKEDTDTVMEISSISLTSEGHALSGSFSADLDDTDHGHYDRPKTTLTGAITDADKKVTINFGSNPVELEKGQSLTFTFFLNPGNGTVVEDEYVINDLTFSISGEIGKDGETKESFNRKTALKKSDGTGVAFKTHQKTRISGLMLPDVIEWTINYGTETDENDATMVTSWDSNVVADLNLNEKYVLSVDGNVTMNYNATSGSNQYFITSNADWQLQYKDANGNWQNASQNTSIDGWISFNKVSGTGLSEDEPITVTAKIQEASGTTELIESNHNHSLQYAPDKGTEAAPWDLSKHDILGNSNPSGAITANCYVISSPGWYAFPLVYGNAIKNGEANTSAYNPSGTNGDTFLKPFVNASGSGITTPYITGATSAFPLWQDVADFGLIADNGCTVLNATQAQAKGLTLDCSYVMFEISKENIVEGNAVIAVSNGSDILWSWHIWVTDADLTPIPITTKSGQSLNMMPCHLGWIYGDANTSETGYPEKSIELRIAQLDNNVIVKTVEMTARRNRHVTTQTVVSGSCTYYQWGRKDPAIRLYKVGDIFKNYTDITPKPASFHNGITGFTDTEGPQGIAFTIKNPANWITGEGNWEQHKYRNLWSATNTDIGSSSTSYTSKPTKTVYDPCPPGYQVPQGNAFTGFEGGSFVEEKGWLKDGKFLLALGGRSFNSWSALWNIGNGTGDLGGKMWTAFPAQDYYENNKWTVNTYCVEFGKRDGADYFNVIAADRACGFIIRPVAE